METTIEKVAKRPDEITKAQLDEIATKLTKSILQLANYSNKSFESAKEDILDVIEDSWGNENGYDLAKKLDDDHVGWHPDVLLVEELDCFESMYDEAKSDLERQWVKDNKIILSKNIGDKVQFRLSPLEIKEGTIIRRYDDVAKYAINTPDLKTPTSGYIINGEELL